MREAQSWVTFASDDREALKALILARSLRHVITRRMLTIFVSHTLSDEIIELLEVEFDRCVTLRLKKVAQEFKIPHLRFGTVSKLLAWRLSYSKIIFVHPNAVVVKNIDHLFGTEEVIINSNGVPFFIATPSERKFRQLVESATDPKLNDEQDEIHLFQRICKCEDESGNHAAWKSVMQFPSSGTKRSSSVDAFGIMIFGDNWHPLDDETVPLPPGSMRKALREICLEHLSAQEFTFFSTKKAEGMLPLNGTLTIPRSGLLLKVDQLHELRNSVAIVGMGMRLPKSNTLEEFWELLMSGNDGISHCPSDRWTEDRCWLRPDSTKSTQAGFLKCPIDEIDAAFFNLTSEEVDFIDPQQRLALQIIWEALENANIDPKKLSNGKVGVYGGWWRQDYKEILQESGVVTQRDFQRSYNGNSLGVMTARISQILNVMGPSVATESGCSTSIVAVDMGCKQLLREDNCDVAIAFGVNLLLHPFNDQTLNSIIAPDGHCKTFDAKADGFGRAEGCVALILKRFPDAVRDGDPIHAIIRGSAVVQEGLSRSLGTPTKECEALAMKLALKDARVEAKHISFVETHGTGTPVGDPLEVTAVAEAYATKSRKQPLVIGSVKTNVGHTESCSGIAGMIKSILSLQHEVIPQHRNFEELNPEIDLNAIPAIIPMQPHPWPRVATGSKHKPRFCGVSSFGITGTDAHCIIQETPPILPPPNLLAPKMLTQNAKKPLLLKLSAKSQDALQQMAQSYKTFLQENADVDAEEFCHLANVGRSDFEYRKVIIAEDKEDLKRQLEATFTLSPSSKKDIEFLFNNDVDMDLRDDTKLLYEWNPSFRSYFDICANTSESLRATENAEWIDSQLFTFCSLYASFRMWETLGVLPTDKQDCHDDGCIRGYLRQVAAGVMSLEDAVTAFVQDLMANHQVTKAHNKNGGYNLSQLLQQHRRLTFLRKKVPYGDDEILISGTEANFHNFIQFCVNNSITSNAQRHYDEESGQSETLNCRSCVNISERIRCSDSPLVIDMATQRILQSKTGQLQNGTSKDLGTPLWQRLYFSLAHLYTSGVDINWEGLYPFHVPKRPLIPLSIPGYSFQNKAYWMDTSNGKSRDIHPLLGVCSSNPSPIKLYQNTLSLQMTPFLRDHVIGSNVIVPGSGFMEICLAAGWATSDMSSENIMSIPTTPLSLGDFIIQAPLCIDERIQIQTTVIKDEESGETRVTLYSKLLLERGTHKWVQHASAIFYPYALSAEEGDEEDTLDKVKNRCSEQMPVSAEKTYDKLNQSGLKFGPSFRTIQTGWKTADDSETCFQVNIVVGMESYLCHPVVADAMFQAILITSADSKEVLHVPVSVSKFILWGKVETASCTIHCVREGGEGSDVVATLYDECGTKKALMIGALLVETTAATILSAIDAQRSSLPPSYEMVWREELGVWDKRLKALPSLMDTLPSEFLETLLPYNTMEEPAYEIMCDVNQLCLSYMILAWKMLGLTEDDNGKKMWTLTSLLSELHIAPQHKLYIRFWLTELEKEGFISISRCLENGDLEFSFIKPTPAKAELSSTIGHLVAKLHSRRTLSTDYINFLIQVGENLPDVLLNKVSGLSVLFPEDDGTNKLSADVYYSESELTKELYELSIISVGQVLDGIIQCKQEEGGDKVLRILEVGAGTGSITKNFIDALMAKNLTWVDYTYTDLSPAFFRWGEKLFEGTPFSYSFKTLNIEQDPTLQGFVPHSFDLVMCAFVIHATENVRSSLENLKKLLSPTGFLFMLEFTDQHQPSNFVFGTVDGFWRFSDRELRPYNCELTMDQWKVVLKDTGYDEVVAIPGHNNYGAAIYAQVSSLTPTILDLDSKCQSTPKLNKTWIVCTSLRSEYGHRLVGKLRQMGRSVSTLVLSASNAPINEDEKTYVVRLDAVEETLKQAFECIRRGDGAPVVIEGVVCLWSLEEEEEESHVSAAVRPFIHLCQAMLSVEHAKVLVITKGSVDVGDCELNPPSAAPLHSMVTVLQNENPSLSCKFVDLDVSTAADVDATVKHMIAEMCIHDDETAVAYRGTVKHVWRLINLKLPSNKLSLPPKERFRMILPSSNSIRDLKFGPAPDRPPLGDYDVEIRVKAYALNFRDLFVVLKPIPMFENESAVGLDLAGEVIEVGSQVTKLKVGDAVCGFSLPKAALPNHVTMSENLLVPIPSSMTLAEASTLPAVACTAILCFIQIAKIGEGDTILIHTGSGGVGLCAIQIAKAYNCRIVATAGSSRKRAYLRNLGVDFVFHSRNTEYASKIRDVLGGQGVDVVLNSLTGPGFKEATLSVCNPGARFVEMSKLNVWTAEEVKELRPDVQYDIADLAGMGDDEIQKLASLVEKYMLESRITPIPYTRFDVTDIRDAMYYMQKAKHIGKVVCIMPEPASKVKLNASGGGGTDFIPLFNARSSYLITGGLGGIGFEVAKWMVTVGAKHVILVGRRDPSDKILEEINTLNSKGAHIDSFQCDVGSFDQCQQLLERIKEGWPPLRGIMHAAGVLSDDLYENQTWSKYMETFHPKVDGGWNLHKLTLNYNLEHFVMFSSMAAIICPMGQSNHSAANKWLDCFAHYRHSLGLPATTINWGQWGQVGVAANLEVIGTKPMTVFQGISVLERILRNNRLQTCVMETNFNIFRKVMPTSKCLLRELKESATDKAEGFQISAEDFWKEYDSVESTEDQIEVTKKFLKIVVRQILKLDETDGVDDNGQLQDMGMDSLMMIEMKNVLQQVIGNRAKVTVNSVKDCTTVNQLAVRIVQLVSDNGTLFIPTRDELKALIREDAILPESIVEGSVASAPTPPARMSCVMVTGATGNLGSYVLKEILLNHQHITKVYCVTSKSSVRDTPNERLVNILTQKALLTPELKNRLDIVECIVGNCSKEDLGFGQEQFDKLSQEVEAVFHVGVKSAWQEIYRKDNNGLSSDQDIRTINVLGLTKLINFCVRGTMKHFYYPSTILVSNILDETGRSMETWPQISDFDEAPNDAYFISKFIGELLLQDAAEKLGLPCKIFRMPMIGGDSNTGANTTPLNNQILLRMMSYMHLGVMPATKFPIMMIPVDTCAELSVDLFFNDGEPDVDVYNVFNPFVEDEQEFEELAERLGHPVQIIEREEFMERLEKSGNNEVLVFMKKGLENEGFMTMKQMDEEIPSNALAWLQGDKEVFLSRKLEKALPHKYPRVLESSMLILERDLLHCKTSGVFKRLGLISDL